MLEKNLSYISNYLYKQSIININNVLSLEEKNNFNMNDYFYLSTIYHLERPNLGQLADSLNLTKPAISAIVRKLVKVGLIEKIQSDDDKRVYYLIVSNKGRKIIEGDNEWYYNLSNIVKGFLDKDEFEKLNLLLEKVVSVLK